jgi:hypothetical protein
MPNYRKLGLDWLSPYGELAMELAREEILDIYLNLAVLRRPTGWVNPDWVINESVARSNIWEDASLSPDDMPRLFQRAHWYLVHDGIIWVDWQIHAHLTSTLVNPPWANVGYMHGKR